MDIIHSSYLLDLSIAIAGVIDCFYYHILFKDFLFSKYRSHYHMIHNNYQRQQGIQQLSIWHAELTPPRSLAANVSLSCSCG